jgi:hypothetical protein
MYSERKTGMQKGKQVCRKENRYAERKTGMQKGEI